MEILQFQKLRLFLEWLIDIWFRSDVYYPAPAGRDGIPFTFNWKPNELQGKVQNAIHSNSQKQ